MARQFKPNPEILKRIASVFYERGSASKTSLQLASRLRWDLSVRYLEWLLSNNYIMHLPTGNIRSYVLTQAGIEMFQKLLAFFDSMK
ncbi:MAG: hypothetical protein KGI27_05675 [Thaumarchaeota archaeon]|nr:hypothetical protein [Nitrososphaerota archaeon]